MRVYFEQGTDIGAAIAQINAVCNTILRVLPPGITPPNILQFNASNVQVAQLTIKSDSLTEQELFDYGLNFLRLRLFTIPGLSTPAPLRRAHAAGAGRPRPAEDAGARRLAAGRGQQPARATT